MRFADAPTPLPPAGDLCIRTESRVVTGEFAFAVVARADPAAVIRNVRLRFPGFVPKAPPETLSEGGVRFSGRLKPEGFHPFEITADYCGRTLSTCDYFLVPGPAPAHDRAEAGYYVFLGCGDYPLISGQESHRLAAWSLADWQSLVAWMGANGMNRLWVLLNGYTLAYPSRRYPELRDRHARNAREGFLRGLIDFGHTHGVKTHLVLTTDGHARDFCRAHPEAARQDAAGRSCPHFGLALEHPLTRAYIFNVLDEVLELYPNADGLAVHPTESDPERFNLESLAAYRADTGGDLCAAPPEERRSWHNRAYARFLGELSQRCHRHNPALDLVMLNCWWQDAHPDIYRAGLPPAWRIAVWHYAWEETTATRWPIYAWTESFGPERIIYMPTSQSYLYPADASQVMARHLGIERLIGTSTALGVRHVVYFAGWDIMDAQARLLDLLLLKAPRKGVWPLFVDFTPI